MNSSAPVRIAVQIVPVSPADGQPQFRASLPMGVLFEKELDQTALERARALLEQEYGALVATLRAMRPALRGGTVLPYWRFGDVIIQFEERARGAFLFVDKLSDHLARDIEYSKTMIDLCRRLRIKFPDASQLDPMVSFRAYHRSGFDLERAARRRK